VALRIITHKRLDDYGRKHADARQPLNDWAAMVHGAEWENFDDVRKVYANADEVRVASGRPVTVFNIKGNRYRLVVAIHYNTQCVYVLKFLTHAEYSKDAWKEQL
jgi:mRNA interferase HigB